MEKLLGIACFIAMAIALAPSDFSGQIDNMRVSQIDAVGGNFAVIGATPCDMTNKKAQKKCGTWNGAPGQCPVDQMYWYRPEGQVSNSLQGDLHTFCAGNVGEINNCQSHSWYKTKTTGTCVDQPAAVIVDP